ncbi:MAG: DegT/DnrJ/EryC1/StrS family aminotransferase [Phycisphaerae bacterium]
MQVPLLDLTTQYDEIRDEVKQAIDPVLESQLCCNGPAVRDFEKQICEYAGVARGIGVSSGTDALLCALMALEIGEGDEVIVPPFTFFATAGAVWRAGATPVFADIHEDTFNIDPAKIEAAVTDKTKAIIPVHLFGQCADMDEILAVADKHNLAVIEDAAQTIGACYKGKAAGTMGTVGCYSFYPTKNLGAMGDAGMIVTNDAELAEKIEKFRNHGQAHTYHHYWVGGNFRMDSIQAAILSVKLRHLDAWAQARRANAAKLDQLLTDVPQVTTPVIREHNESVINQYVIRAENRDELRGFLNEKNIASGIYYPLSLHQQDCFRPLGYSEGDFPVSEQACREVLALPVCPELSDEQVEFVGRTIAEFYSD